MTPWIFLVLGVLALTRRALSSAGDICYVSGALASIVDNELYFIGGNYSTVSYNGQVIEPSTTLYSLSLDTQFPVERSIPQSSLTSDTINADINSAYEMAKHPSQNGAIWRTNDTMYFFGGGFETGVDTVSSYNVSSGKWENVQVSGGDFNFGNRTTAQSASVPEAGLGFIYGGTTPYMTGMLRFDASDPNNVSWTNETLNNGSFGVEVPNLNAGTMLYIPASTQGMLISFGGGNISEGISPDSGWPYEADWNTIYIYDIASHTWWMQQASGNPPANRDMFCAAVAESPDRDAFHITTYGGWSLTDQRSYEDVNILTIPSFQWIDATELSNKTNLEQQTNSTIGRDSIGSCQTYQGSQMVVLGGDIRAGAYSLTNGACSAVFEPIRVLDLSTYQWRTDLNTSSNYEVPSIIYEKIGGNATGGATVTVPAAGFADATLASLLQKRVPSAASPSSSTHTPSSSTSSSQQSDEKSSGTNTGAIAGGVVGGVVGLAFIVAIFWYMMARHKKRMQSAHSPAVVRPSELPGEPPAELDSESRTYVEMPGENKRRSVLR